MSNLNDVVAVNLTTSKKQHKETLFIVKVFESNQFIIFSSPGISLFPNPYILSVKHYVFSSIIPFQFF